MVKTNYICEANSSEKNLSESLKDSFFESRITESPVSPNNLDDLEVESDFREGLSDLADSLENILEHEQKKLSALNDCNEHTELSKNNQKSVDDIVNDSEVGDKKEIVAGQIKQNVDTPESYSDLSVNSDDVLKSLTDELLESKLDQLFEDDLDSENNDKEFNQELMEDLEDPDNVELITVDDSFEEYADVKYPCLLINGATSQEEIDFLKKFQSNKKDSKAIFLYCEAPQGVIEVGYVELSLHFLLTLSRMPGYRLFSVFSEESTKQEIDLTNPKILINFISF